MKFDKPSVSVIVPVFKVEDYLGRCIYSVVNQTYSDLQIILIDDGSSDDCALMCDEWAEKDARITVIHKLNGGLSDARNYGMRIICGDYVSFIDSDDYISENFIEVLLSTALKNDSDIVECDYIKFFEYKDYGNNGCSSEEYSFSSSNGLLALIEESFFSPIACNKLFSKNTIQGILFETGKQHEDVFWTYQVFGQAERITKINRTMYFYFQRESSIMGQGYNLRRLDALEAKWRRQKYIEQYYPELILQAKLDFFASCMYMMQCVIKYMSGRDKRQAVAIIRKYKKLCGLTFKDIDTLHGSSKKYFYMAKINIYLCGLLRAKFNIGF